jgi:hypothetical protein
MIDRIYTDQINSCDSQSAMCEQVGWMAIFIQATVNIDNKRDAYEFVGIRAKKWKSHAQLPLTLSTCPRAKRRGCRKVEFLRSFPS